MAIVKETMLILVSATANSNKFYHVTLDDQGVVSKRYGRVGVEGVTNTERTGETGYNKVIAAKKRKGYKETEIVSEAPAPVKNANLSSIARKALVTEKGNSLLLDLVDVLVRMNNHDILESSGGLIKVNKDGLVSTPLGQVTTRSIHQASNLLNTIQQTPVTSPSYTDLLGQYLTLVPQKVPSKRGWHKDFFNENNSFFAQREFLKKLNESVALWEERQQAAQEAATKNLSNAETESKYEDLFSLKIGLLEDKEQFKKIEHLFTEGKSSMHHASNGYKLKRVYVLLENETSRTAYEQSKQALGNQMALWHGTRAGNVLSILRKGLYCPPRTGTSIQTQGRMFGSGVYFAPAYYGPLSDIPSNAKAKERYSKGDIVKGGSTKSLNYSVGGVWDRGLPRDRRCFMILGEGVLGKEYSPNNNYDTRQDQIQRGRTYNSIHARPERTGLRNPEIIIWNNEQISVRYLCEFEA